MSRVTPLYTGPGRDPTMEEQVIEAASGLGYVDRVEGTGRRPQAGDSVSVHSTGWPARGV